MSNFTETCSMSIAHEGNQHKSSKSFPPIKPLTEGQTVTHLSHEAYERLKAEGKIIEPQAPANPPPPPTKQQVTYPSGYQRSKVPSWHLLHEDFLLAMVRNMEKGEAIDGPGNPPNYLKATEDEDQYTDDHLRNHLSDLLRGIDIEANAVAIACNAMIRYRCIQHRKAQCKSK